MSTIFPQIFDTRWDRERLLRVWVGVLVSAAIAMCLGLVAAGYRLQHPLPVAVLALLAIAAEHEGIRLTPAVEVSVASLLGIFAVVAFGPLPSTLA